MNDINKQMEQCISSFVADLHALVRQAAIASVTVNLGGAKQRGAKGLKVVTTGRIRRSADEIAAGVAMVVGHIKAHPNLRSEDIRKDLKMPRPVVRDALDRLMASKKIKMKGEKRAATYTAA